LSGSGGGVHCSVGLSLGAGMNDAELLRAYAGSGSEEAFRSLVDRWLEKLWREAGWGSG